MTRYDFVSAVLRTFSVTFYPKDVARKLAILHNIDYNKAVCSLGDTLKENTKLAIIHTVDFIKEFLAGVDDYYKDPWREEMWAYAVGLYIILSMYGIIEEVHLSCKRMFYCFEYKTYLFQFEDIWMLNNCNRWFNRRGCTTQLFVINTYTK